jgi:predicted choloylglycine hydrolase
MAHKNYFEIEAPTHFELGLRKGELFGEFLRETLEVEPKRRRWKRRVEESQAYLAATVKEFPELVDEMKGYAEGAKVAFDDLWTLELEEELDAHDHCTAFVTNNGFLIAHNEDWTAGAQDNICVLRRQVGDLAAYEIFYLNTLGGNSISVNSHGIAQSIESLVHSDHQVGVPKKVVARWMSDTASPEKAYERLAKIKRASGYHHLMTDRIGSVWSIECSAAKQSLAKPALPFAHTNHYLNADLRELEENDDDEGTFARQAFARTHLQDFMSFENAEKILRDASQGRRQSIFNPRTIASVLLDTDHMSARIWLRREQDKGWVDYSLRFDET